MRCPRCQADNADDRRLCGACGAALAGERGQLTDEHPEGLAAANGRSEFRSAIGVRIPRGARGRDPAPAAGRPSRDLARSRHEVVRGRELAQAAQPLRGALDVRPPDDAVPVDEKLAFQLTGLLLGVLVVGG